MKKIILTLAVGLLLLFAACSNRANETLEPSDDLGGTNVYDFGGINDWPYESVSG